ncbi:MAG: zinc ribbon domain-containing protein [Actinomycetia bacterium]|nr:zinc ribbon domain-containing protein [Actinomycetes bacterium]
MSEIAGCGCTGSALECGECTHTNRAGARFCGACGSALGVECCACNEVIGPADRFCDRCGEAVVVPASATTEMLGSIDAVVAISWEPKASLPAALESDPGAQLVPRVETALEGLGPVMQGTSELSLLFATLDLFDRPAVHPKAPPALGPAIEPVAEADESASQGGPRLGPDPAVLGWVARLDGALGAGDFVRFAELLGPDFTHRDRRIGSRTVADRAEAIDAERRAALLFGTTPASQVLWAGGRRIAVRRGARGSTMSFINVVQFDEGGLVRRSETFDAHQVELAFALAESWLGEPGQGNERSPGSARLSHSGSILD